MAEKQTFVHEESQQAVFVERGLRTYFEYRDLGIKDGTHGDYIAHVIRAKEGHNATGKWHWHDCTFQFVYVLKGWARFEYEGQGVRIVREGDCVMQPAGIRHREIEHSADFEVLEIVAPANFETHECEAPASASDAAD